MESNLPLTEQFRRIAKKWVEADEAASLMEETKSANFAEMVSKIMEGNLSLPVNRAELIAKSSDDYKQFITTMIKLRSEANLLKVQLEFIRMRFQEENSRQATQRAEMRL